MKDTLKMLNALQAIPVFSLEAEFIRQDGIKAMLDTAEKAGQIIGLCENTGKYIGLTT